MKSKSGAKITERSILLIDDEKIVLESVNRILAREGYKVSLADSGKSGLEMFEKGEYPLVITDLIMEGLDGVSVIKRVKEAKPETKIIAITGCGKFPPTVDAIAAGADDYLLKPCSRDELIRKVAGCFEQLERQGKEGLNSSQTLFSKERSN